MRVVPALVLLLLPAIGTAQQQELPGNAAASPCPHVWVDQSWREIRDGPLVFCAPGEWLLTERLTENVQPALVGPDAAVTYGSGEYQPLLRPVHIEPLGREPQDRGEPIPTVQIERHRFVVDSRWVEVDEQRIGERSRLRAAWPVEGLYLSGESETPEGRATLFIIIQTVQFTSADARI